jgi:hypothetical protein
MTVSRVKVPSGEALVLNARATDVLPEMGPAEPNLGRGGVGALASVVHGVAQGADRQHSAA